jgi:hypothetical protein
MMIEAIDGLANHTNFARLYSDYLKDKQNSIIEQVRYFSKAILNQTANPTGSPLTKRLN